MSRDDDRSPTCLRPAPAYQTYASDEMANEDFMLMSLAERGLRTSMRHACWINDSIPGDPTALARIIGSDVQEVKDAMTTRVLKGFAPHPASNERLVCPELVRMRAAYTLRRQRMVEGGGKGGRATQERRVGKESASLASRNPSKGVSTTNSGEASGVVISLDQGSELSGGDVSGVEVQKDGSIGERPLSEHREWIREYDAASIDRGE